MDNEQPNPSAKSALAGKPDDKLPENWGEALMTLIASRFALIQLESKDAARLGASRAAAVIGLIICIFFAWALLLAGLIAAISLATDLPWFWVSIGAALLHLAAAAILAWIAKKPAPPSFPYTKAEFQKDREWLENLQKTRKSNV